jgi:hypothetical protein
MPITARSRKLRFGLEKAGGAVEDLAEAGHLATTWKHLYYSLDISAGQMAV